MLCECATIAFVTLRRLLLKTRRPRSWARFVRYFFGIRQVFERERLPYSSDAFRKVRTTQRTAQSDLSSWDSNRHRREDFDRGILDYRSPTNCPTTVGGRCIEFRLSSDRSEHPLTNDRRRELLAENLRQSIDEARVRGSAVQTTGSRRNNWGRRQTIRETRSATRGNANFLEAEASHVARIDGDRGNSP